MTVYFNTFSCYATHFFKGSIPPALTAQQKKILIVTSVIFGLLAICYLIKPYFTKKAVLLNGLERQIHPDGSISEGLFRDGKLEGQGKKTYREGTIEEGQFKEGKLHGQGKITKGHVDVKGESEFGLALLVNHVKGSEVQEGEFKEGYLHGFGKKRISYLNEKHFLGPIQLLYEGNFKEGHLHGQGRITCDIEIEARKIKEHTIEEGEFKEDSLEGKGMRIYANGLKYEGEFKKGELNGQGKITYSNGSITAGIFKKNLLLNEHTEEIIKRKKQWKARDKRDKCPSKLFLDKIYRRFSYLRMTDPFG